MTNTQHREVMRNAQTDADDFVLCQLIRGVPVLVTATACALVIGKIIGSISDDHAQAQRALEPLLEIARLTAAECLPVKVQH